MQNDQQQYTNLYNDPDHAEILAALRGRLKRKLAEISKPDLKAAGTNQGN